MTARKATCVLLIGLTAWSCGGEPPESLGGFELGLNQDQVLEAARSRGGFGCRFRSSRPPLTVCEGPAEEGLVTAVVRGTTVVSIALRLDPSAARDEPEAPIRRFVRPFGEPAWRDRPVPPRSSSPDGYHTQWVDEDSLRSITLVCSGRGLRPPCTAELTAATPGGIRARLDTLLGIRR